MCRDLKRELRGGTEGSKRILCESPLRDRTPRIYVVVDGGENFIAFDPCYELGNVYVYKQVGSMTVNESRKEFREHRDSRSWDTSSLKEKVLRGARFNLRAM